MRKDLIYEQRKVEFAYNKVEHSVIYYIEYTYIIYINKNIFFVQSEQNPFKHSRFFASLIKKSLLILCKNKNNT